MQTTPASSKNKPLDMLDSVLLAVLIVVMCSQIDLMAIGRDTLATDNFNTKRLFLAISDVSLVLVFGWFVLRTSLQRSWKSLWWPPLPCWALIFVLILAMLHSPHVVEGVTSALEKASGIKGYVKALLSKESKEAIVGTVQWAAYFLAAPLLFVNLIVDRRGSQLIERRRLAFHAFAGAVALNVLAGLVQRFSGSEGPQGLFGSPNIYSAFLAFSLPLLLAHALSTWAKTVPALVTTLLCVAGALLTMTSAPAVLALVLGLGTAAAALGKWTRAGLVALLIILPCMLLWRSSASLYELRDESVRVPSSSQRVKKQIVEWYAAFGWSMPGEKVFATGVGPDNYQFNIGSYYSRLPNEEKMAPDSNNLYTVQMVATGMLGLSLLFWLFGHFGAQALAVLKENGNDWLAAGVLASLSAFAFVNIFHAMIVRGAAIAIAFVLSLAIVALQTRPSEGENHVQE